ADWLSDAESPTCSELPFAARYRVVVVHLDGPARSLALQSRTLPHAGVWCVVAGSPRAGGNRVPLAGARWCFACRPRSGLGRVRLDAATGGRRGSVARA